MLAAMPDMVHSPLRIARPAIREGWREGRPRTGADSFHEVSWDEALDTVAGELARVRARVGDTAIFGGSYGWSSAGRVHHARTLVRRFLFLGGGCVDQVGNYSLGAAQFLLPHVIGTYRAGDRPGHRLGVDHQAYEADHRVRRPGAEERQVTLGRRRCTCVGDLAAAREASRHRVRVGEPAQGPTRRNSSTRDWIPIRPNTDTAMMLAMAHTLSPRTGTTRRFHRAIAAASRRSAAICSGKRRRRQGRRLGGGDHRHSCRHDPRSSPGAPPDAQPITCAWSLQRAHHGEQPYWAAIALAAMLGGIGLPGGGFAFGHGSINGVGVPRIDLPAPGNSACRRIQRRKLFRSRASPTCCCIPAAPTSSTAAHETYPDIRLIYWAGGNPFHHHQDLNRLRAPGRSRRPIVVHESWWTPTARHADIVLPATTTLERNDVGGSSRDPVRVRHASRHRSGRRGANRLRHLSRARRRLGYAQAFTEGRDEMGWCRWVYEHVAGAARKGVTLPAFQEFWPEGLSNCRRPTRLRAVRGFPPRSGAASAEHAVGTHRDLLRHHRGLRLRRLSAASRLDRAGRMARRERRRRALADASGDASAGRPPAQPDGSRAGVA